MRSTPRLALFVLATACWLAAGPGGETTRALIACSHEAMHHAAGGHHSAPASGPCFCDQMTGGLDLAVSTAVPAPPTPHVAVVAPITRTANPRPFTLPPSPALSPVPPPPIVLG